MNSLQEYKELIVFDCETTGLDPFNNHVIELACCKYSRNNYDYVLNDKLDVLVKIDYPLPSNIIELTGITDGMIINQGFDEHLAVEQFYTRFVSNNGKKKLFIAYNAPFDINFINQMMKRHRCQFPSNSDYLDVLTVYKDRASYPHKLIDAIRHYQLSDKISNSHRAIDDCVACFEVLRTMGNEFDDLNRYVNLFGYNPKYPPLHRLQRVLYKPQYYGQISKLYSSR